MLSRKPSPDYERVLTAITRSGVPDRVPFMELFADYEVVQACNERTGFDPNAYSNDLDRALQFSFWFHYHMGYDYVPVGPDNFGFPRELLQTADPSATLNRGQRYWTDEHRGPIGSWEDFERYPWPDPASFSTRSIERATELLPEGMCLRAGCHSIFEQVTWLFGYETLCYKLHDDPALVDAMFDRIGSLFYEAAKVLVQFDEIKFLMGGDDMGYKTQTMISAKDLIEKSFPWHQKITQLAHEHGKPNVLHACGNRSEIMEAVITYCEFDAIHSFEDVIEPITQAKRKWGDRIALIGGIDVDFLCRATPEEVRRYVRKVLRACMSGGGYCLGSGNSVTNYVPLENYIAMLEEGIASGNY